MWLENLFGNTAKCWQTFYGFLQIYHSYYNEKSRVDKLASFTLAYKGLAYIKHINKFWGEIYSENCQLFE